RYAVEEYVLVDGALQAALGAGAVVTGDVDEDGVVRVGQLLHGIDDAAHFMVALRPIGGEYFHHAGVEPLLVGIERIPCRQSSRSLGKLCACRDDSEALLPLDRLLAILVPAHVELAPELVDPVLRGMVRGVRRARRDIEQEWPVR